MSNGWNEHLEQHAAIGAVFDTTAWEKLAATAQQEETAIRTKATLLNAQLDALWGAVMEQEAQVVEVLHALKQPAAPTDLRAGPVAPPLTWDDGVHDLQQHLAATTAAVDEACFRGRLPPLVSRTAVRGLRGVHPELDRMHDAGWNSACALYEALTAGVPLQPLPAHQAATEPGEVAMAEDSLDTGWFYRTPGLDLDLDLGLLGQAEEANAIWSGNLGAARRTARWREHGTCRVVATNRRIQCVVNGDWYSIRHDDLLEFTPDVIQATIIVRHRGTTPLRLRGPRAPAFALVTSTILYGVQGLALPAFAPLVMAAANRRRGPAGHSESGGGA